MAERNSILVTPTEKHILSSLRELPEGHLRRQLEAFLVELTDFVRDPKCPEVQADGIPCDDPKADCEQCQKVGVLLETLRGSLPDRMARS
jgi:hypothetical protein